VRPARTGQSRACPPKGVCIHSLSGRYDARSGARRSGARLVDRRRGFLFAVSREGGETMRNRLLAATVFCLTLALVGCAADSAAPTATTVPEGEQSPTPTVAADDEGGDEVAFELTSTAYVEGEEVPVRYTCDGEDISPPLAWAGVPEGTVVYLLVFGDPDAPGGTWDHWIRFDIPAATTSLDEAQPAGDELADGSRHGANSWGRTDYGGPCPPSGTHRYVFKLFALDTALGLPPGARKAELLAAIEGHVLGEAELLGTYAR
jgi:Raf kinase inhibitor-like YbhB/YbcL family protein